MLVGYALTCRMQLPAVSDTITEARYQARKHGRLSVAAIDIRNALLDYQIPSDEALREAFHGATNPPEVRWSLEIRALEERSTPAVRCNAYARPLHSRQRINSEQIQMVSEIGCAAFVESKQRVNLLKPLLV